MGILQTFPAKVTCMYIFRSNYKIVSCFFSSFFFFVVKEEYFHKKLLEKAFGFKFLEWHAVCKNLQQMTQPDLSICDLKTLFGFNLI